MGGTQAEYLGSHCLDYFKNRIEQSRDPPFGKSFNKMPPPKKKLITIRLCEVN